jgi:hypothetical protein
MLMSPIRAVVTDEALPEGNDVFALKRLLRKRHATLGKVFTALDFVVESLQRSANEK